MSDISLQPHLFRRNSTYYFRAKIPPDLQPFLGRCEEKFSLKTKNPREARRLVRPASADFEWCCERLRAETEARRGRPL